MRHILVFTALFGTMLAANSPAQNTTPSPANPQPQQPASMQPGTTPPTEPQGSAAAQTPQTQSPSVTQPAQAAAQPAGQVQPGEMKIAPGSVIPVQLSKGIDAKKAKTGDEVIATVTRDMKTQSGEVLVPKDTQVIGHVTESQARNKEQKESEVGIAFDRAVVKGDAMQLPMSIQAVIGPQDNAANNSSGGDQSGPAMAGGAPTPSAPSSPMGSSRGGATAATPPPQQSNLPAGSPDTQTQAKSRPAINGTNEGVIGISNLKLEPSAQNSAQGSVLSSDKNNVKIDKGTMMLLRVNP